MLHGYLHVCEKALSGEAEDIIEDFCLTELILDYLEAQFNYTVLILHTNNLLNFRRFVKLEKLKMPLRNFCLIEFILDCYSEAQFIQTVCIYLGSISSSFVSPRSLPRLGGG